MFVKPNRQVNKVFIHCSASDVKSHDNIAIITKWHIDPKPPKGVKKTAGYGNGWKWVGYHFFIRKDGTIEKGRSLEIKPAAQGKDNPATIAICLSGGQYGKADFFTQEQFESLRKFCEEINQAYYKITFHGHCEVSEKECPVFDYKEILDLDDEGLMPLSSNINDLSTKPKKKMMFPLLISGAVSLVKLFAPTIINKFKKAGKNLAEDTAKKLIGKVEKKLGFKITDEESAIKARDQLDSKDLFELEKLALKTDARMFKDELKYGEDLGETWKDDAVTYFVIIYFSLFTAAAFKSTEKALEVAEVITTILATPFGIVFILTTITAIGGRRLLNKLVDKFIK